jgi:hypothetical protein
MAINPSYDEEEYFEERYDHRRGKSYDMIEDDLMNDQPGRW